MKQGQRLNLKWSVATLDLIRRLACARKTADEISRYLNRLNPALTSNADEIAQLCNEMRVFVRRAKSA